MSNYGMKDFYSDKNFYQDELNLVKAYLHENYAIGMHAHDFYELNIVWRGSGEHLIDGAKLKTQEGDVFVIPPFAKHCYRSDLRIDVYHLLFFKQFFSEFSRQLKGTEGFGILFDAEPSVRRSAEKGYNLKLNLKELERVGGALKEIVSAGEEKQFSYQNATALALVCYLSKLYQEKMTNKPERSGAELIKCINYVNENLDGKITLPILCERACVSSATLNRIFRANLGLTPMQYVKKCRVEKAARLIKEKKISKTEIAQACGFYDLAHLNKNL
ncbi:MAG: helix-turn-helix domain-containing protein [Clostridiales bacterium]|nr:helix-turn-helix domain-containing protein [Clostridiales bacterium]